MLYRLAATFVRLFGYDLVAHEPPSVGPGPQWPMPSDFDRPTADLVRRVQPYTLTSPERIAALKDAVRYIISNDISGDIVECGVWKGGSMMAVALTLQALGARRHLHLFDTFEGMTAPTAVDRNIEGELAATIMMVRQGVLTRSPIDEVKDAMRSTGYDERLINYVKGPVEDTLPRHAPPSIALLRLDTDWYESTRHELHHLFPRLNVGGVLIIDDYGHWEGARKAVDEYIAENRLPLLLHRIDYTARICVRPPH
jgi:O-methyltransferase